ncbi:MAG: 3-isopropylmalate dehydratase, small subunit, partial [Sporomusa sp.]|nr:3-isopropylmalate dehydratase, small subunit [Sporomusa sp.]
VSVVIAKFFARIFFRNAINIGLAVVECADVDSISEGDQLEVDLETGRIKNLTKHQEYQGSLLPAHIMAIVEAGGLVPYLEHKLNG